MLLRIVAVFVALFAFAVSDAVNQFTFPPSSTSQYGFGPAIDGTYFVGDDLNFSWQTNWTLTTLTMWQVDNSTLSYLPNSAWLTTREFVWNINLDGESGNPWFNLSVSKIFWFGLYESNTLNFVGTQYVNIVEKEAVSSLTESSTSSQTSASNSPSASTPSSASHTSSVIPSNPPTGGLSTTAKVGLGVGLGVGFVALTMGFVLGLLLYGRKRGSATEGQAMIEKPVEELDSNQLPVEAGEAGPRSHLFEL